MLWHPEGYSAVTHHWQVFNSPIKEQDVTFHQHGTTKFLQGEAIARDAPTGRCRVAPPMGPIAVLCEDTSGDRGCGLGAPGIANSQPRD